MSKDLITAFKDIPLGECPRCGKIMIIVDVEALYMSLNDDGDSVSYEEAYERCEALCKCGFRMNLVRRPGGYDAYNPIKDYHDEPSKRPKVKEPKLFVETQAI